MIHEEDEFSDEHASFLLAYTLHESPFRWLLSLPAENMHSFKHLCDVVEETFYHFDPDYLDRKLLQGRLRMNRLLIFSSASMTCSFKLR